MVKKLRPFGESQHIYSTKPHIQLLQGAPLRGDRHADPALPRAGVRGRRRHVRLHHAARGRPRRGRSQGVLPPDRHRHPVLPQATRCPQVCRMNAVLFQKKPVIKLPDIR